jgi:hypothetical protein
MIFSQKRGGCGYHAKVIWLSLALVYFKHAIWVGVPGPGIGDVGVKVLLLIFDEFCS